MPLEQAQTTAEPEPSRLGHWFAHTANQVGKWTGHPIAFFVAFALMFTWAVSGPFFHFSDTWQLVINTGTTIAGFLLLFVIQSTQNRNTAALHLKLDELLRATPHARTDLALAHLEDAPDDVILKEKERLLRLAKRVQQDESGGPPAQARGEDNTP